MSSKKWRRAPSDVPHGSPKGINYSPPPLILVCDSRESRLRITTLLRDQWNKVLHATLSKAG